MVVERPNPIPEDDEDDEVLIIGVTPADTSFLGPIQTKPAHKRRSFSPPPSPPSITLILIPHIHQHHPQHHYHWPSATGLTFCTVLRERLFFFQYCTSCLESRFMDGSSLGQHTA
jgi:hypothetical protein